MSPLVARFPLPTSLGGPTPPSLNDWQWQFNGVTLGPGTSYGITKVTGMNLATIRTGDQALPREQGEMPGLDVYGGRDVELDLWMTGSGGLVSNQLALSGAMLIGNATPVPLWLQIPTLPLLCVMGRVRKRDMPWDAEYAAGAVGKPVVSVHCNDPRVYTVASTTSISLASGGGGLGFPVGPFPVTFGQASSTATTVKNSGNTETRPLVIFNGPVTNPWIANNTTGASLYFTNPGQGGYTVAAGDQLVVDLAAPHRILYYSGGVTSGVAPSAVRDWLNGNSTWWTLIPGSNQIQYGSQDTALTGLGAAEVVWSSAYQL